MNFLKRVVTSIILLPLLIADIYYAGYVFALTLILANIIIMDEIVGMGFNGQKAPRLFFLLLSSSMMTTVAFAQNLLFPLIGIWIALAVCGAILTFRPSLSFADIGRVSFVLVVALYAFIGLASFYYLRIGQNTENLSGRSFIYLCLICTFGSDTFAYIFGKLFGRRPLFLAVSQKKTWEGFIGGAIGCVLLPFILQYALLNFFSIDIFVELTVMDLLLVSCGISILAPLGDLIESRVKRAFEVKDSGGILPGHGGLFDRIDALMLTMPFTFCYAFILKAL